MTDHGEFSVYQFFLDETSERVESFVDPQTAVETACRLTRSVGAKMGTTARVISGDFTCFEWQAGKGVTYPPECAGRR